MGWPVKGIFIVYSLISNSPPNPAPPRNKSPKGQGLGLTSQAGSCQEDGLVAFSEGQATGRRPLDPAHCSSCWSSSSNVGLRERKSAPLSPRHQRGLDFRVMRGQGAGMKVPPVEVPSCTDGNGALSLGYCPPG